MSRMELDLNHLIIHYPCGQGDEGGDEAIPPTPTWLGFCIKHYRPFYISVQIQDGRSTVTTTGAVVQVPTTTTTTTKTTSAAMYYYITTSTNGEALSFSDQEDALLPPSHEIIKV